MKTKILFTFIIVFTTLHTFADNTILDGKTIFTARCATCHKLGTILVGPDLIDVDKRRNIQWIVSFVNNSSSVIKSGDKEANALFEKFNKIQMPEHPDLKEADIKNVVAYIKSEKANIATASADPFATPAVIQSNYKPLTIKNDYHFMIGYLALVCILIGVLFFGATVQAFKR